MLSNMIMFFVSVFLDLTQIKDKNKFLVNSLFKVMQHRDIFVSLVLKWHFAMFMQMMYQIALEKLSVKQKTYYIQCIIQENFRTRNFRTRLLLSLSSFDTKNTTIKQGKTSDA